VSLAGGSFGKAVHVDNATAGDIARLRVPVIDPSDPLERGRDLAAAAQWDMVVVVSDRGIEGWLDQGQLEGEGSAGDAAANDPTSVSTGQDVDEVAETLDREGLDRALVTDAEGKLMGVLFRADIEGRARAAAEGEQERAPDVET
jgi:CBS domain-containing protein